MEKTASPPLASGMDSTTGSSHVSTPCQPPGTCRKPPIIERTLSTATGHIIASGPSKRSLCRCSRTKGAGSPKKTMNRRRNV